MPVAPPSPAAAAAAACAACGTPSPVPHLAVAGDAGEQGLAPTTDRFGVALADIARCTACGHMQLDPMPTAARLREAYEETASDDLAAEEAGQRATARATLARIERLTGPGTLLDLGCWLGFLLLEARERGWRTLGVEPSRWAAARARERGLEVLDGDLDTVALPAHHFDAVVMGDVIEHLPDPGAALDRIAGLLAPGGVLWMALPDAGSRLARVLGRRWWSVIPTHVQYFTRDSVQLLLRRHGYRPVEVRTAPKVFTVRYYAGRLGGYSPAVGRGLVAATERAGVADRLWGPDFRDRMAVLAYGPGR